MTFFPMVFAYLGPETMLPMTSVVAGAAGVAMMFGRASARWVASTFRRFVPSSKPVALDRRIASGAVGSIKAQTRA